MQTVKQIREANECGIFEAKEIFMGRELLADLELAGSLADIKDILEKLIIKAYRTDRFDV